MNEKTAKLASDNIFAQYQQAVQNKHNYTALKEFLVNVENAITELINASNAA